MRSLIAFLCCLVPTALSAQDGPAPYEDVQRQYYELIELQLGGGKACPARGTAVIQKQRDLAQALATVTPSTGPRVMLFAVAANSLGIARRLNEAGAPRTGDNGSLLHVAARFADPAMLEYL